MIEAHAPHHAIDTWRDFFIHIATIVVGLLIAVGLEQTVEYIHHRVEGHEALELLQHEFDLNAVTVRENVHNMEVREQQHRADLGVVQRLRNHTLNPSEGLVFVHVHSVFVSSAWKTVHESGAAAYIPYDVLTGYATLYDRQADLTEAYSHANLAVQTATAVLNGVNEDPSRMDEDAAGTIRSANGEDNSILTKQGSQEALAHLTPTQIDRLELGYQEAIEDDRRLKRLYIRLERSYEHFDKGK
jgi:hypothetical protein